MTEIAGHELERTKYATKFEGPEGRELWRSGRVVGDEIVVPEGQRPFPEEDRVYTKVEEVKTGKRKQDADEAVFDAMEEG